MKLLTLDIIRGVGMPYDKEKFDNVHILLPKEYKPKLAALAKKKRRKISPYIVDLIIQAIEEDEKNSK